jgi:hypothetical protein
MSLRRWVEPPTLKSFASSTWAAAPTWCAAALLAWWGVPWWGLLLIGVASPVVALACAAVDVWWEGRADG